MNAISLTIHRSDHEIGGNCVEIATSDGSRLILDVGRPLDAPDNVTGILPRTLDLSRPVDGILISHPHQDHYGLLEETPEHWRAYGGEATGRLIRLTADVTGRPIRRSLSHWQSEVPLQIGPFRVTPYLTDHSAFDAYMLLIEIASRRLFYSGDFRCHGRKSALVRRLMANPPPDIDVLIMEGTNLGNNKPWATENDLREKFVALFREATGRVFVAWSAQNIDRTVSLYSASRRAGRTLVIDLYTAEVLDTLKGFATIPQPGWRGLAVVITSAFVRMYRAKGKEGFVDRMARYGISADKLAVRPENWVIMTRPSLILDYGRKGVEPNSADAWSWSMWLGYLDNEGGRRVQNWFDAGHAHPAHIHTSGHASALVLRQFATAMNPRWMVPIHGTAWDSEMAGFPTIKRLKDGETFRL